MIRQVTSAEVLAEHELIAEYGEECSIPGIGPINPQGQIYSALEQAGALNCFGAFDGDKMVGFALLLQPIIPHYGVKVGTPESLFVAKTSIAGRELMAHVEQFAKDAGSVGILYSAPVGGRFERYLEASKEYQRTNAVFFRRFDARPE